ncbi:MAG TPA: hypothetical protein VIZ91_07735 [Solirubrobacterales bacterium]
MHDLAEHYCPSCGRCLGCGLPADAHEEDEGKEQPYVDWTDDFVFERQAEKELEALIEQVEGPRENF